MEQLTREQWLLSTGEFATMKVKPIPSETLRDEIREWLTINTSQWWYLILDESDVMRIAMRSAEDQMSFYLWLSGRSTLPDNHGKS